MPVIFHLVNGGTPLMVRGERLGFVRSLMYRLGLPFRAKAFTANDRFCIRPRATTHFQEISDHIAAERKKAFDEKKGKDGKKPGPTPAIPSGK